MSDSFRLGLGLVCMFFSGWMIHSALSAAKDLVVGCLLRSQEYAKAHPYDWTGPAGLRDVDAFLLELLTGGRQGLHGR